MKRKTGNAIVEPQKSSRSAKSLYFVAYGVPQTFRTSNERGYTDGAEHIKMKTQYFDDACKAAAEILTRLNGIASDVHKFYCDGTCNCPELCYCKNDECKSKHQSDVGGQCKGLDHLTWHKSAQGVSALLQVGYDTPYGMWKHVDYKDIWVSVIEIEV